jgi:WD40 repeat protein
MLSNMVYYIELLGEKKNIYINNAHHWFFKDKIVTDYVNIEMVNDTQMNCNDSETYCIEKCPWLLTPQIIWPEIRMKVFKPELMKNLPKVKTSEEIMGELISQIDYYNTFSLYYILLGHSQQIRCLYYVASKKVLVTSSDNCTVKIYDMNNGFSLYHFNLDCIVNKIILVEKKNIQNLILFSEDPYKLIIDITKEPFSFNHYSFKYNNSLQLEKMNTGYYLLGPRQVYQFDNNLEYKATFTSLDPINYSLIKVYKNNVILFDAENFIEVTSFQGLEEKKPVVDPKNKKAAAKPAKGKNDKKEEEVEQTDQYNIKTEFKVKVGNDEITECYIYEQFGFCCCQDNNLYLIDLELKKDMKYERYNMDLEDDISAQMMNILANTKAKKKKGKGKDGKKKKKK